MEDILIITGAHDIPIAESIARDLPTYKAFFFDPTLADAIDASTLRNFELLTWESCPDYPTLDKWAHDRAFDFERELDRSLRSFLPDCSLQGWQHLNLYYLFIAYFWYSALWGHVAERLRIGKPFIFVSDNPVNFYWPSFLPGLLLLQQLKTLGIPFSAVTYGPRADESDVVMNLQGVETGHFDLLTHLPTCFHDAAYFSGELTASGKTSINIAPKYWRVDLAATKNIGLIRLGDLPVNPAPEQLIAEFHAHLDRLLEPYIATADFRTRQVRQLSNLYYSQLVCLGLLEESFKLRRPARMLLSDHDAGFHGPLLAFAQRHKMPVLQAPHSKVSIDCPFGYENITVLTHPLQAETLVNSRGKRSLHHTLFFPEQFSGCTVLPKPLKKIGLILNGIALNSVLVTQLDAYLRGIRQIDQWCGKRGIELSIRCRPGQSLFRIIEESIGMERAKLEAALADSLQVFAGGVDLCLMYGPPTSASLIFLQTCVPVLNPIPMPLAKPESLSANTQVIPRFSVADTLELLGHFVDDEGSFEAFRYRQFADYLRLFKMARPLRDFC